MEVEERNKKIFLRQRKKKLHVICKHTETLTVSLVTRQMQICAK